MRGRRTSVFIRTFRMVPLESFAPLASGACGLRLPTCRILVLSSHGRHIRSLPVHEAVAQRSECTGRESAMNSSGIKPAWVFVVVLSVFPAVGLICSAVYGDVSMLWTSLIFLACAAVIFPVGLVLLHVLLDLWSAAIISVWGLLIKISEALRSGRR